ncbi:MAG TPA: hypothetical protein VG815_15830 [Chloroflexota bacterium]|nr:hypothetical protein [Chloroflexota bacterium]
MVRSLAALMLAGTAFLGFGAAPAGVAMPVATGHVIPGSAKPAGRAPSFLVFMHGATSLRTVASPCTAAGCPNELRLGWTPMLCTGGFDLPPVLAMGTVKNKYKPVYGATNAPCHAASLRLKWSATNKVTSARWHGAPAKKAALKISNGSDGADLIVQSPAGIASAGWFLKGKSAGKTPVPRGADSAFWYGYTPPPASTAKQSFARRDAPPPPLAVTSGKTVRGKPESKGATAPPEANDIDFAWKSTKCSTPLLTDSFVIPLVIVIYTKDGTEVPSPYDLTCPIDRKTGEPIPVNDIDFGWGPSADGARNEIKGAVMTINGQPIFGPGTLPPPPPGVNDLHVKFESPDGAPASWTKDGALLEPPLPAPFDTSRIDWYG